MKIGDLVQIDVLPDASWNDPIPPEHRGIVIDLKTCEYMPSYHIYRLVSGSTVWLYEINVRLINPS